MREKLHDIVHFETGEILREDMFPVDVAIFLKRNAELELIEVEENSPCPEWDTDTVYVDGSWPPCNFSRRKV